LQSDVQRGIETRPVLTHRAAPMQRVLQVQSRPEGLRYENNRLPTRLPTTDETPNYRRDSQLPTRLPITDKAPDYRQGSRLPTRLPTTDKTPDS
jgi:hypothetical protein